MPAPSCPVWPSPDVPRLNVEGAGRFLMREVNEKVAPFGAKTTLTLRHGLLRYPAEIQGFSWIFVPFNPIRNGKALARIG